MRKKVMAHVTRLPIRYFDSTQTGILISRIMTDAEGIRNLVGTGLAQLTGSIVTAIVALGVLFYLNWQLTVVTLVILVALGGAMSFAFSRLRPIFRERGKINADLSRSAGGNPGWDPHREGLHGREARAADIRQRGAHAIS